MKFIFDGFEIILDPITLQISEKDQRRIYSSAYRYGKALGIDAIRYARGRRSRAIAEATRLRNAEKRRRSKLSTTF